MKISVVIPVLNGRGHVLRALESVWAQTYSNYEILVIDGGSTDGTVELLKSHSHRIHYWKSAPDSGTSQAMNEGYHLSNGDLVTFLCADDEFRDHNVFADVIQHYRRSPGTEVLCTEIDVYDPTDRTFRYVSRSDPKHMPFRMSLNLPGSFMRREVLEERQFLTEVEVANDYELFAYLLGKKQAKIDLIGRVSVRFSIGGRTNSPRTDFWMARDCFYLRRKYYGLWPSLPLFFWDVSVGVLRKLHIRPLRWSRQIKRVLFPRPLEDL